MPRSPRIPTSSRHACHRRGGQCGQNPVEHGDSFPGEGGGTLVVAWFRRGFVRRGGVSGCWWIGGSRRGAACAGTAPDRGGGLRADAGRAATPTGRRVLLPDAAGRDRAPRLQRHHDPPHPARCPKSGASPPAKRGVQPEKLCYAERAFNKLARTVAVQMDVDGVAAQVGNLPATIEWSTHRPLLPVIHGETCQACGLTAQAWGRDRHAHTQGIC